MAGNEDSEVRRSYRSPWGHQAVRASIPITKQNSFPSTAAEPRKCAYGTAS
jgi:hypothetical protein